MHNIGEYDNKIACGQCVGKTVRHERRAAAKKRDDFHLVMQVGGKAYFLIMYNLCFRVLLVKIIHKSSGSDIFDLIVALFDLYYITICPIIQ